MEEGVLDDAIDNSAAKDPLRPLQQCVCILHQWSHLHNGIDCDPVLRQKGTLDTHACLCRQACPHVEAR